MTIKWSKWDETVVQDTHGNLYFYRDLYDGKHSGLFPRAQKLIAEGDVVDIITDGSASAQNVRTPYMVANVAKLIPEIPATLVARSLGPVTSSLRNDDERNDDASVETDELIDGPDRGEYNAEIDDLQQELIRQIELNSSLQFEHWGNVVQHQVDGGLVGVPWMDERGLRIEFKSRDVYYPHEDGLGADLAYHRTIDEEEYLHVYRERVEAGDLHTQHLLYRLNKQHETEELDENTARELLGIDELETTYPGRGRLFIVYWPNEKTFMNPLGVSCLKNQEGKQDEINWTLTRNALTFERNGKPRIAVSGDTFAALEEKALERYGDAGRIDHRDLEITTFDEKGQALEIIQIDVSKIGDIQWVKDLVKMMFMETRTSEKAVDFYLDKSGGGNGGQSGVAKFYDLFVSLVKAEQLQAEYVHFLQQLMENALWLAAQEDSNVRIEQPDIAIKAMVPISRKELVDENIQAFTAEAQSLEETVRRLNPTSSEEWIREEVAKIEEESVGDDTTSLLRSRYSMANFLDNRSTDEEAAERTEGVAEELLTVAPDIASEEEMKALNGAQITSVLGILERMTNGTITKDQALALLTDGLKINEEAAKRIIKQ